MKKLIYMIAISFIIFAVGSLPLSAQPDDAQKNKSPNISKSTNDSTVTANSHFIVYYFHGKKRCMTCRTIESYTHDAVQMYFKDQLESGLIEWQIVNYANPKFAHFKDDFELYTQSVVVVEMADGKVDRWKNLKDVWTLTRDKDAFYDYIKSEVKTFISEG